ncbi:F-box/kelch-repeat protein At5g43190 [Salvia miltiorrhiza]|uniref:F-box/kelch-repeat protein At5g43190 n=1 Tax=Salvia miltiorrhiza TaxID=226208 RepID=UPI0025ACCB6C|nr:F-box/kelch-repeat protein At5g43190 [Salvia miltiorrhiza]
MDPRIWSKLPDHLLEHVLSFLPLKAFLGLRSTCKHFKSLPFTPYFISRHSLPQSPPPFSSFLLLSHPHFHHTCPIFNTALNTWCSIPLSFPPMPSSHLVASSHGLLCYSVPSSSCFVVCNLLSRSLRRLKFPACPFAYDLPTLVPSAANTYKLFMLSTTGSSRHALVYDSAAASWQRFPSPDPPLNENHHQKGVLHDGGMLFTTPEPFLILSFRVESGKWETPPIDLPEGLVFARLAGDGDRKLYLVGGVGASGISRSMKLWELGGDGEMWMEVETMPEMVCRKFLSVCYHNYEHVYCFWHQGLICVCCYTWPEILYYKVSRRTWHWLPKCPSLPEKWSCGFRWFSFTPQLYASA